MAKRIRNERDLEVYVEARDLAMELFELSKQFPFDERFSMTSQIRRASRSVAANITEAWRKRRYEAAFVSKLSDAETEAAEVQTWIEFAVRCRYMDRKQAVPLFRSYDALLRKIVNMMINAEDWLLPPITETRPRKE